MDSLKWTLRFKCHTTTVLLLVSPNASFDDVRVSLLNVLKARGITEINGKAIPENASDIELGFPLDRNNLEKGWALLEIPESDEKGQDTDKNSIFNASPNGGDIKDSQALAFRFRKAESEPEGMEVDDPGWDVLIPSYDDDEEEE